MTGLPQECQVAVNAGFLTRLVARSQLLFARHSRGSSMSENSARLTLESFPARTHDKVRYADTDRQGHVNNAAFATFCETGRVEFLFNPEQPLYPPGTAFVIARLVLDFRGEIRWPGTVEIGTRVEQIGRSSLTLKQALFQGEHLVATAETVIVLMDEKTRRSTSLPPATVDALRKLMIARADQSL